MLIQRLICSLRFSKKPAPFGRLLLRVCGARSPCSLAIRRRSRRRPASSAYIGKASRYCLYAKVTNTRSARQLGCHRRESGLAAGKSEVNRLQSLVTFANLIQGRTNTDLSKPVKTSIDLLLIIQL